MAGKWASSTVGAVSKKVTKGTTPTTIGGRFAETGVAFVKVESITDDGRFDREKFAFVDDETNRLLSRSMLEEDDVLFTIAGTIGRVAQVRREILPANTNQAVAIVRPDVKFIDPRFLYYVLRDEVRFKHAHTRVVQSVQANFSLAELSSVEVPLPPKPEQRAIAQSLGTLDDKIELNRQMNQTLEAMARALFKSWFGDFEPVRAKAEGHDAGLPRPLAGLFPDSFEDSELGEIPKGWKVKAVGDLAEIVGGSTPSTKEPSYWESGVHAWATPKDLAALSVPVLLDTDRRITDAGLSQIGSGMLPAGTVLLSSRAPIGYLAVAELPVAINQGFIAMRPKAGISNLFLLLWAKVAHEEILSRANGSTFLEISKSNFRPIPVITPSADVMRRFEQLARPLYERIVECARQSRTLAALRDQLLPKLISGELRVKDAERLVAA